jgi:hypothetical protein
VFQANGPCLNRFGIQLNILQFGFGLLFLELALVGIDCLVEFLML